MHPDHVPGVIRLLEADHSSGVADVRLWINKADALNAISQSTLRSAAEGDVSAPLDTAV